ncbi:MAG: ATP-binding protein [Elusimicrobiota bacterium]
MNTEYPKNCKDKPPRPRIVCEICGGEIEYRWVEANTPLANIWQIKESSWCELGCMTCLENKNRIKLEQEEKRRFDEKVRRLITDSAIKKRFLNKSFENYELTEGQGQEKVFKIAKEFADNFKYHLEQGTWLCFLGNPGTGKSHLCSAIIQEVCKQGYSAVFTKTYRLLQSIKECWRRDAQKTESEVISELEKIDLLCIDELFSQFISEVDKNLLFLILDTKYESKKTVIMASNESFRNFEELLGEKMIDRIYECGKFICFNWQSYRRKQRIKQAHQL